MSIVFGGTTVDKIIYNNTELDKVIFNGTEVFSKGVQLTVGTEYTMGDFKFVCAEDLGNGNYAMQMSGVTSGTKQAHGVWPGYKKNNNSYYTQNVIYTNIASRTYLDTTKGAALMNWMNTWQSIESNGGKDSSGVYKTGSSYKNGLYLIPYNIPSYEKYNPSNTKYAQGLENAAKASASFGVSNHRVWVGDYAGTVYAHVAVSDLSSLYFSTDSQNIDNVIAPVFNIDISKINLNGTKITKK